MRLSNFFKTPSSWIQRGNAIDKNGRSVNLMNFRASDYEGANRIEKMSLYGAIAYYYSFEREPETRNKVIERVRRAISQYTGKNYYIAEFNDLQTTTFDDIKNVLKISEKR